MLIKFDDGTPFAKGGAQYNTTPDYLLSDHIVLLVEIGEQTRHVPMWEAVVHTAVPYLVCSPEVAKAIGIDEEEAEIEGRIPIEGKMIEGKIYSGVNLVLLADEDKGKSVPQPVWVFVPNRSEDFIHDGLPEVFLGIRKCLDTFLFAVDPLIRTFYFG